jgi:hypothetical protein
MKILDEKGSYPVHFNEEFLKKQKEQREINRKKLDEQAKHQERAVKARQRRIDEHSKTPLLNALTIR